MKIHITNRLLNILHSNASAASVRGLRSEPRLASFWLGALLFILATSHLQAQLTPWDDLPVLVVRLLGSDQITVETGTFYADGRFVSTSSSTVPRATLNWSQAQFEAANGKPLYPGSWEDSDPLYANRPLTGESSYD